jgi:hypothetical protein
VQIKLQAAILVTLAAFGLLVLGRFGMMTYGYCDPVGVNRISLLETLFVAAVVALI